MWRVIKYVLAGIVFGIILSKSQAVSWYRIQEMFRFQSFHMYGIIGTAVITGIIAVLMIKKFRIKDMDGAPIVFPEKDRQWKRYLFGGTIFGLGWALTGACPGPIFILLGQGYGVMVIVIFGALAGTYVYGMLRNSLPH
jgi:uncharacterized membrane protein YedE/YeeE